LKNAEERYLQDIGALQGKLNQAEILKSELEDSKLELAKQCDILRAAITKNDEGEQ
jgi:hypothetical protein